LTGFDVDGSTSGIGAPSDDRIEYLGANGGCQDRGGFCQESRTNDDRAACRLWSARALGSGNEEEEGKARHLPFHNEVNFNVNRNILTEIRDPTESIIRDSILYARGKLSTFNKFD
jgi:hypothetical protein